MIRFFFLVPVTFAMLALASCGGEPVLPPTDDAGEADGGGLDSGRPPSGCEDDLGCDDGLFCTGVERCMPGTAGADARGCVAASSPCTGSETCDEGTDACAVECVDFDGDGHRAADCGGDDCDDRDERRYPGAMEVCDSVGVDEDCDSTTLGPDADADRYVSTACCNELPTGRVECGLDCDDTRSGVSPEAVDSCGNGDEDCDGAIDENPDTVFYRDLDGDGHGVSDMTTTACSAPPGYAVLPGDCDDTRSGVNPGVGEICNLRDDDCDGSEDEGCDCTPDGVSEMCGDTDVGACRLGSRTCVSGMWSSCSGVVDPVTEICDGILDDDCDGTVDDGCECVNGNTRICGTSIGVCRSVMQTCVAGAWPRDCSAEPGVVSPSAEQCDGLLDQNCDGAVDEGCACTNGAVDRSACGTDTGECVSGMRVCTLGAWGSCSGGTAPVAEVCDGSRDENCDGATDEGCACTNGATQPCGVGACAGTRTCTAGTWAACGGLAPAAEVCNGIDDDCDGLADAADADTQMVGTSCGSSTGLCTIGSYTCPGASLVCGGIAPAAETCDHRDQDCDGLLDDGAGVATCSFSRSAVAGSTSFRNEFTCSSGSCGSDTLGRIDNLASGASTEPRTAVLTVAGELPDWGERFTVQASFDIRARIDGASGIGPAGVFISPSGTPSTGTAATQGLPILSGSQRGFAALYQTNYFLNWVEIWEMTSAGNTRRAIGDVALAAACRVDDSTSRRYTVTLSNVGETITATVTGSGCGTSTATYTDTDWQTLLYGDSETAPFPRYQVGAIVWNNDNMIIALQSFGATRTSTASRGNCIACPW